MKPRHRASQPAVASLQPRRPLRDRWALLLFVMLATAAGLRPVTGESVWWQLSRGRAVCSGTLWPSNTLLAQESAADADWLGTVPCYVAYRLFGETGLVLWRLASCAAMATLAWRMFGACPRAAQLALASSAMLVTKPAWDVSPVLFGLVGLWCVDQLARNTATTWALLPAITVTWANVAPAALLAPVVFLAARSASRRFARRDVGVLLAMIVAIGLTPRGFWTWRDSLLQLVPQLAADSSILAQTSWHLLWHEAGKPEFAAWCVLMAAGLVVLMTRDAARSVMIAPLSISALAAWLCAQNVAIAGWWSALLIAQAIRVESAPDKWARSRLGVGAASAAVVALSLTLSAGWWPGSPQRLGWGLSPQTDVKGLAETLSVRQRRQTVFCVDTQTAGAAAWLGNVVDDEPGRALLGGRLRSYVLLCDDLAHQREASYYRTDGSEGGWRAALMDRHVVSLLIPIERTELLASLADSTWRPLDLASLLVPYGQAGDPACSRRIVEVLKQEQVVARGPWSAAALPRFGSGSHWDLWGLATGQPDAQTALRQAAMFEARHVPTAALKLLFPLRETSSTRGVELFDRLQSDLAWLEYRQCGQISRLRELASRAPGEQSDSETAWNMALERYRRGEPTAAADALPTTDAEGCYARGWLRLEAGEPIAARREFRALIDQYPEHPLTPLASHELAALATE